MVSQPNPGTGLQNAMALYQMYMGLKGAATPSAGSPSVNIAPDAGANLTPQVPAAGMAQQAGAVDWSNPTAGTLPVGTAPSPNMAPEVHGQGTIAPSKGSL